MAFDNVGYGSFSRASWGGILLSFVSDMLPLCSVGSPDLLT